MRVELLFLRWLLVIALVALGLVYANSSHQTAPRPSYELIPLVQGGRSAGLPLAAIAIDPHRRDVYAIVGGPAAGDSAPQFCIVWKGKDGESYGTTFPPGGSGPETTFFEVSPEGQVRAVHDFSAGNADDAVPAREQVAQAEPTIRSIIELLPGTAAP